MNDIPNLIDKLTGPMSTEYNEHVRVGWEHLRKRYKLEAEYDQAGKELCRAAKQIVVRKMRGIIYACNVSVSIGYVIEHGQYAQRHPYLHVGVNTGEQGEIKLSKWNPRSIEDIQQMGERLYAAVIALRGPAAVKDK